ncbi:hypothetical protein BKA69DRAFT_1125850 [Paraphysoderma sedebokerense]|nr:hypothetical protein BKA69DRAFT_1125850 [Paraphysoderma sedebokerense]
MKLDIFFILAVMVMRTSAQSTSGGASQPPATSSAVATSAVTRITSVVAPTSLTSVGPISRGTNTLIATPIPGPPPSQLPPPYTLAGPNGDNSNRNYSTEMVYDFGDRIKTNEASGFMGIMGALFIGLLTSLFMLLG